MSFNFYQHKAKCIAIGKNRGLTEESGIYIWTRYDIEKGATLWYVGKASNLAERTGQHILGYSQHLDLSIKKHKDWIVKCLVKCKKEEMDDCEKDYIAYFIDKYGIDNCYNKQSGGKNENGNIQGNTVKKFGVLKDLYKGKYEKAYELLRKIYKEQGKTFKQLDLDLANDKN